VPGKRTESLLYRRIAAGEMPPEGKTPLTAAQRELIGRWIDGGARTRGTDEQADEWGMTPTDRSFWSFQPLRRPDIPDLKAAAWPLGPLDAFVQARLEANGLQPSPRAAPRDLVRRLSFALRGLPPSCDEVDAFSRDASADAYAVLVDRYLNSPQFGERWARLWLDLVRYVDEAPNYLSSAERAWLYRDWVIRAFNEDRPYDEFVRLQLAADLIQDIAPDDLAALGFLGLSPTYWKELRLAPDVIKTVVAEEWDERIDMVSRTVLGLTVSCARCHDHKFDPVTQRDYYALAGVIASTQLAERPLLPPREAAQVRSARAVVAGWEAQHKAINDPTSDFSRELQDAIERFRAETPHFDAPWAHVVEDAFVDVLPLGDDQTQLAYRAGETRDLPVFRRGNPSDPGEVTPRRFLAVLSPGPPRPYRRGSGRLELAESLLTEAQGLTARVFVNRVWRQLFGRGLVQTPSDFGRQGERPTHPALLEYLASRLVEEHWSLKRIVREMVLSATYQQSSQHNPRAAARDPENALLWRMNRLRLDIEPWRDSLLMSTGALDDRLFGPAQPVDKANFARRTLYGKIVREELQTMLRLYDFPEAAAHCPAREHTTTPLQQLFVLNGPLLKELAAALNALREQQVGHQSPSQQIDWCYRRLFQRPATVRERQRGMAFVQSLTDDGEAANTAWRSYLQVLLGLNETMYVD